ncbi:MAG: endonuclease/exonuclease/phosphatase family protein [Eubacteriales bacterium]
MDMKPKIRVVTYNLKCDSETGFKHRLPLALKRIESEKPDIIGFQEALPHMQRILEESLNDYYFVGFGRDSDFGGESNCVAYRRDTYHLFGFNQCWLSPTPYVPGTRFEEQSSCPRFCTTVILKHREHILPFRIYNTHLDHVGEKARILGMTQILEKIKSDNDIWRLGIILTGDMNAEPFSQTITNILSFEAYPLKDTTDSIKNTFHDFGKLSRECKIDYIFTDRSTEHSSPYIWDDYKDGVYISDHYPVSVDIIL